MIRLIGCFVFILISATSATAQTIYDGRAWFMASLQGRATQPSSWRWSFDWIARSRDGLTALDTSTFRPMLVYNATPHSSFGGGYVFVTNYLVVGGTTTEHRVFGIYTWTGPSAGGTMSMRVRVEDRMIEANSGALWRVRPQAKFSHPVHPGSKLAIVGWDEVSVHLNTTTAKPRGLDQNRAFGGIGTAWSKSARAEIGYLNQYVPGHGAANRMNHVVSTTVTLSF